MNWQHNYHGRGLGKFFKDLGENIKHSMIKHRILVCDIVGYYDIVQKKEYFIRDEYWTDTSAEDLHENGYRICEGLHDNLAWIGVPVMSKLHNIRTFEITDPNFSKDTPTTLNDRMNNNLLTKFAKSLARANALAGMDLQKMFLMIGIGVAAVVGMKLFGVF